MVLLEPVLRGQEAVVVLLEPVLRGQEAVVAMSEPIAAQQEALMVFVVHMLILHSKQLLRQWVSVKSEDNVPAFTGNSGIKAPLPNNPSTGDILSLFLTGEFFDILVEQKNLHAAQYKSNNPSLPPHSCAQEWFDTTRPKMKQFITLSLLMGIVVKPGISDYWRTSPPLKGSIFNSVMSRNRFQSSLQFLHFADNSQFDPNDADCDRLYKVRRAVDYLVNTVKTVYS